MVLFAPGHWWRGFRSYLGLHQGRHCEILISISRPGAELEFFRAKEISRALLLRLCDNSRRYVAHEEVPRKRSPVLHAARSQREGVAEQCPGAQAHSPESLDDADVG